MEKKKMFPIPKELDRYEFEERAAIYEYDGKFSRQEAEKKAYKELIKNYQKENK